MSKTIYYDEFKETDAKKLTKILSDKQITELQLTYNTASDNGIKALANCLQYTQITHLDLQVRNFHLDLNTPRLLPEAIKTFARCLKYTQITTLILDHNEIGDAGCKALAKFLEYTQITYLNLEGNNIGDQGAKALTQCLKDTQITTLILNENKIGDAGCKALAQCLKDTQITRLDLRNNDIGESMVEALAQCLKDTNITELDLTYNSVGNKGIKALVKYLEYTKMTDLLLSGTMLTYQGVKALAQCLKDTQITYLDLGGNDIEDQGAKALAQCLKDTQITTLILDDNEIGDAGCKALAQCLKDTQITYLDLGGNDIGDQGAKAFINVLDKTLITECMISCNNTREDAINDTHEDAINKILHHNKRTVEQITNFVKEYVVQDNNALGFRVRKHIEGPELEIEQYLTFMKTMQTIPSIVSHLIQNKDIPYSKLEILKLKDNVPSIFGEFVCRSKLSVEQNVNILEMCDSQKLTAVTENLLLHRSRYYISKDSDKIILHPCVYILLAKYPQSTIHNDPAGITQEDLIKYFSDHLDIEGAQDVISLVGESAEVKI